jgi:protein subunit release factor B
MPPMKPAPEPPAPPPTRFHLLDDEALLAQCEVQVHRAGGPGGQHRNKTETAVRLVHGPSGVVAEGKDQRSRAQNLSAALGRLREKLAVLERPRKKRRPTKPSRGAKERRLGEKRAHAERKAARRGERE